MQQWEIKNLDSDTHALLPSLQQHHLSHICSLRFSQQVETKKKFGEVSIHIYIQAP